jgi:DNA polymerase
MAMGLELALPGKLELAAEALECIHQKDKAGHRLMLMMAKPRRLRQGEDPDRGPFWFDDEDRLPRLYKYCQIDTESQRELHGQLKPLSTNELRLWQLDCLINDRGFYFDRTLALAARKIAQALGPDINAELAQLTDGAVTSIHQVAKLKDWLAAQGCITTKVLDKSAIDQLLGSEDLSATVRRALELRADGAHSAARKIDAFLARCDDDGRIRGAFQYHGASTGRWGGRGVQPQNLKQPVTEDIDAAVAAIATGDLAHVKTLYPQPLAVIGDISRNLITAAPGHILIGADFSSIESRVLALIAGEEWKLDSYRRFDATQDPRDEPYCITACKIFRVADGSFDNTSPERKVGKICDLAFGYQGGLPAWRKFEPDRFSDEEVETFKNEWRAAHPNIKKFW